MREIFSKTFQSIGDYLPNLLGALAILIIGWLLAYVVAACIKTLLKKTTIDNKIAQALFGSESAQEMHVEDIIAKVIFYVMMAFVTVEFFSKLQLTMISEPINNLLVGIFEYFPRLIGASIWIFIAWLIATVLRRILVTTLEKTKLDEKIGGITDGDSKKPALSNTLAEVLYWLVFLLFLPFVLDALKLEGPLQPVQTLLNKVSESIPQVIYAGLIFLIGWFIARMIRRVVTNFLASLGIDRLSERIGLSSTLGEMKLSGLIGLVLYIFILLQVIIAGLDQLRLDAVTQPASAMVGQILNGIPSFLYAVLILGVAFFVARLVATLVTNLLSSIGFNKVLVSLGITKTVGEEGRTPSAIVGTIVMVAIITLAAIEASRKLGFEVLAGMLANLAEFGGHVLMGLVIFGFGIFLANIVGRSIQSSTSSHASFLSCAARGAILVLAGAMALRQMDVANEIVNLAFGLLLGSVAVAFALAFGLGGRESAAKLLEQWRTPEKK